MNSKDDKSVLIKSAISFLAYILLVPGLLFTSAGTFKWKIAWLFFVVSLTSTILSRLLIYKKNPDLIKERANYTRAENVLPRDRLLTNIAVLYAPTLLLIVAGLDFRFEWTDHFSTSIQYLALFFITLMYVIASWAMVVNRYFSAVARLQKDRGQVVVKEGPYQIARHPAYASSVFSTLAMPIMFNSLIAFIPAIIAVVFIFIRTKNEDQMLQDGLEGYKQYAQNTRHRLIPGIW